jgi:hypothetical protein
MTATITKNDVIISVGTLACGVGACISGKMISVILETAHKVQMACNGCYPGCVPPLCHYPDPSRHYNCKCDKSGDYSEWSLVITVVSLATLAMFFFLGLAKLIHTSYVTGGRVRVLFQNCQRRAEEAPLRQAAEARIYNT